jgi:hypothetical protein
MSTIRFAFETEAPARSWPGRPGLKGSSPQVGHSLTDRILFSGVALAAVTFVAVVLVGAV